MPAPYSGAMEWMLQVVDEIDDLLGALAHCLAGARADMGPHAATVSVTFAVTVAVLNGVGIL
jgi:hypothetical protein